MKIKAAITSLKVEKGCANMDCKYCTEKEKCYLEKIIKENENLKEENENLKEEMQHRMSLVHVAKLLMKQGISLNKMNVVNLLGMLIKIMIDEKKKYDNQTVARRLALQTLNNIDTLSFNDIKRRLTDIIEYLSPGGMDYREK